MKPRSYLHQQGAFVAPRDERLFISDVDVLSLACEPNEQAKPMPRDGANRFMQAAYARVWSFSGFNFGVSA